MLKEEFNLCWDVEQTKALICVEAWPTHVPYEDWESLASWLVVHPTVMAVDTRGQAPGPASAQAKGDFVHVGHTASHQLPPILPFLTPNGRA